MAFKLWEGQPRFSVSPGYIPPEGEAPCSAKGTVYRSRKKPGSLSMSKAL